MAKITVKDTSVTIISVNENDYISLTDIARYKSDDPTAVIGNWLRNRNTIEYLGIWESLYNPSFKPLEFEGFKKGSRAERLYLITDKMDKYDKRNRHTLQIGTLRRHLRSQGYSI